MKALILNSGMGTRMGNITEKHPKCMTKIDDNETIISHQLKQLHKYGVSEIVITTGYLSNILVDYCNSLNLPLNYTYIFNPIYKNTNYIYSIYLAREYLLDDIILMHGDLVFDNHVLENILNESKSCMAISSKLSLPEKDFKAVIENGRVKKIGVNYFENAVTAQPLYKLLRNDWDIWLNQIAKFCKRGKVNCYAEDAFNDVSDKCHIHPLDIYDYICKEIDTQEDLFFVKEKLNRI